ARRHRLPHAAAGRCRPPAERAHAPLVPGGRGPAGRRARPRLAWARPADPGPGSARRHPGRGRRPRPDRGPSLRRPGRFGRRAARPGRAGPAAGDHGRPRDRRLWPGRRRHGPAAPGRLLRPAPAPAAAAHRPVVRQPHGDGVRGRGAALCPRGRRPRLRLPRGDARGARHRGSWRSSCRGRSRRCRHQGSLRGGRRSGRRPRRGSAGPPAHRRFHGRRPRRVRLRVRDGRPRRGNRPM
ncbi:MAG: Cobalamin synthase, partial [uncultured Acidimicrobiales bacterium]